MRRVTGVLASSVLAIPVTLFALHTITAQPSSKPSLGGCGEHRGLVVAGGTDVSVNHERRALVKKWNAGRGHEHATLVEVGSSADEQRSELVAAAETHSCAYDVMVLDSPWTAEFAERGFVTPIRRAWVENPDGLFPSVAETGRWRQRRYAVPWNTDAGLLYVRKGTPVPRDWNALLGADYAAELADYEGLTVNALEVVWNTSAADPALSGTAGKVDVATARDVILPALRRLAGSAAARTSSGFHEADALGAFVDGREKVMRHWPYAYRTLTADPRLHDRFEVAPLPGAGISVLGGQNLAVSRYSRHKEAAGALVRYLTGSSAESTLFSCGGFAPTRMSALSPRLCDDPAFAGDPDVPTPERLQGFSMTLANALLKARPRPITPYYTQFSETFRTCVRKVIGGGRLTPKGLADALNAALEGRRSGC